MAMQTLDAPQPRYFTRHVTYRIPLIGRMAREVVEGDEANVWYAIAGWVSLWMSATLVFGVPGLVVPALLMAFVMMITLIRISLG